MKTKGNKTKQCIVLSNVITFKKKYSYSDIYSDHYYRFEGITCRSMESITLGLDTTTSKHYCNEDKNCLAVDTNVGFKSCNYPNVVHPTTKQGAQLYKNQVVSGTNLTRKLVKYAENNSSSCILISLE